MTFQITRSYTPEEEVALERAVRLVYDVNSIDEWCTYQNPIYQAACEALKQVCVGIAGPEWLGLYESVHDSAEARGPLETWVEGRLTGWTRHES